MIDQSDTLHDEGPDSNPQLLSLLNAALKSSDENVRERAQQLLLQLGGSQKAKDPPREKEKEVSRAEECDRALRALESDLKVLVRQGRAAWPIALQRIKLFLEQFPDLQSPISKTPDALHHAFISSDGSWVYSIVREPQGRYSIQYDYREAKKGK